jgi:hypothetical protein
MYRRWSRVSFCGFFFSAWLALKFCLGASPALPLPALQPPKSHLLLKGPTQGPPAEALLAATRPQK